MPPKVEISEDTIAKLVRNHLESQSEESSVKRHVKKNAGGYVRLIAALGALTAAINGYADLKQRSVELSEQNALAFKALSSKVNRMAEKMAYMQGRMDGLSPERAEEAVELKIEKFDPAEKTEKVVESVKRENRGFSSAAAMADEDAVATAPAKAAGKPKSEKPLEKIPDQMQVQRHIEIDAFEQLPEDLNNLIAVEKQAQEQLQEEL